MILAEFLTVTIATDRSLQGDFGLQAVSILNFGSRKLSVRTSYSYVRNFFHTTISITTGTPRVSLFGYSTGCSSFAFLLFIIIELFIRWHRKLHSLVIGRSISFYDAPLKSNVAFRFTIISLLHISFARRIVQPDHSANKSSMNSAMTTIVSIGPIIIVVIIIIIACAKFDQL